MNLKRRHLMLGAGLATALPGLPAMAQDGFEQPPEASPAPAVPALTLQQARLPNGLRLLVLPRPGAPRTALRLIGSAGWLRDPAGREGLAEVALSMLAQGATRGKETMDSADIAYASDLLGRPLQLDLSPLSAELALEATPDACDDAVSLLSDLVTAPTLTFEALEHVRGRAQDALLLRRADAEQLAPWAGRRLFWGAAYPLQTSASLKRLKRDEVQAFHRLFWRPDRTQLLFCGDLTLETARELAEDFYEGWRTPKPAPAALTARTADAAVAAAAVPASTARLLQLPRALACRLVLQTPVPRSTPVALRALARHLLQQRLGEHLPWPWRSDIEAPGGQVCWRLSLSLPPEAVPEVLAQLREQLPRLAAEPVTPEELAMAQALALGEWQTQLQTAPDELLAQAIAQGDLDDTLQWPQRLRAVSAPVLQLLMSSSWRESRTQVLLVGEAGTPQTLQRAWPGLSVATIRSVIGE
ncbi:Predicted Zn-dependent peptidase [Roseateles sp. YR242]|uniref:M16 family metallopeptidase n=1 Tax=Roseateles sp. YR242 TaxID=1855305 RepID=UPI0008AF84BA|nr:insulinase family protein [Roseateles sp. YR242]SEK80307.1 Predicted Zn-dependent peptidase [Roseateles sp. YR242]